MCKCVNVKQEDGGKTLQILLGFLDKKREKFLKHKALNNRKT